MKDIDIERISNHIEKIGYLPYDFEKLLDELPNEDLLQIFKQDKLREYPN